MAKLDDSTYEVQLHKATVKHELPIPIAFWVYSLAKMQILEFYFNFWVKFFDRSKLELSQMAMDLLYFAIGRETLEVILKPEMHSMYFHDRHLWLLSERCNDCVANYIATNVAEQFWVLKPCCAERLKFDKRMPGLFKLEFQGDKFCLYVRNRIFVSAITNASWPTRGSMQVKTTCNLTIMKMCLRCRHKL